MHREVIGDGFGERVRVAGIEHTADADVRRGSCAWYRTVLSAEIAFENEFVCFLRYDDEHHRIGIINAADATPLGKDTAGVEHFAFTFEQLSELLSTYLRLKLAGIQPFWTIIHGPTVSMYYRDPNGVKQANRSAR